jgi:Holliday junction resolvasome RuvABC endonuclease subunit
VPDLAILALDLGTATGWALLDREGRLASGVQRFDLERGESPGMRFLRFRRWLKELLVRTRVEGIQVGLGVTGERLRAEPTVDVLAYERPHHRGGAATQLCLGFQTVLLEEAALLGLETLPVHTARVKKVATGKGNAEKAQVLAAARARFREQEVQDDNQADALFVLAWAAREVGVPV